MSEHVLSNPKKELGQFIGVGVGPGDPELLTLKAFRLIKSAPVISYLCSRVGHSQALDIARLAVTERSDDNSNRIEIVMPMSKDRRLANEAYDDGAERIRACLNQGSDVIFLCEGDPLFFGSFAYLLERLESEFSCAVVPGISSVNAASSALLQPLTMLTESFAVVSGRHTDEQILAALSHHASVVIIKAGVERSRIVNLLADADRTQDAAYLEYIGRDQQHIERDISKLPNESGPYFSLFVVSHQSGRQSR